jgi:SAM-dependent methyltransferase
MVAMMDGANREQAAFWQEAGRHWVTNEERYDGQLRAFLAAILAEADLRPGMAVVDVGCGFGTLSVEAARVVGDTGSVLGVDLSAPMLERARSRAEDAGVGNATFLQADAQTHGFGGDADRVVSRFGVMFFSDPEAAFRNLLAALRPGGGLAVAVWQGRDRNPWMGVPWDAASAVVPLPVPPPGAPGPFSLSDADRLTSILSGAGFHDISLHPVERPLAIAGGGDLDEALAFLAEGTIGRVLAEATDEQRPEAWDAVREALGPYVRPEGVVLDSAAWVVTAERR